MLGVGHLRMELDAEQFPGLINERSARGVGAPCDGGETAWRLQNLITVAHPYLLLARGVPEQRRFSGQFQP